MHLNRRTRAMLAIMFALALSVALSLLLSQPAALARIAATTFLYPSCGASLQACINDAVPGDTIVVAAGDYHEPATLTLTKAVSLTGVSSGTVIFHAPASARVLQVTAAQNPISPSTVISGLTFVGGNVNTGATCPLNCGGAVVVSAGAQPSFHNVVISGSTAYKGGGLYVDAGKTITLDGVLVMNNVVSRDGGGINANSTSPLVIFNGRIENNRSTAVFPAGGYGGGILADAPLTLDHSDVISNAVSGPGGGVYASGRVDANYGTFERNQSGDQGGGLRTVGSAYLTLVSFYSNTAAMGGAVHATGDINDSEGFFVGNRSTAGNGGALWAGGLVYSFMGTYRGNTAAADGGAVAVRGPATLANVGMASNSAAGSGGALLVNGALSASGGQFISNTAANGAGAFVTGSVTLGYVQFISNTALQSGCACGAGVLGLGSVDVAESYFERNRGGQSSGIYAAGSLTLANTVFVNNQAIDGAASMNFGTARVSGGSFVGNRSWVGGGLYLSNGSGTVSGTQFISNASLYDGGALFSYPPITITNALFMSNTAGSGNGGGVYAGSALSVNGTRFISNTATAGGGLYHGNPYNQDGRIVNSLFAQNRARSGTAGADLQLQSTATVVIAYVTLADVTPNPAPAIAVVSGTLLVTDTIFFSHAVGITVSGALVRYDYDLFFGVPFPVVGNGNVSGGAQNVFANPRFVNVPAGDFHLDAGSAAIDTGVNVGVATDFDGEPRPVGGGFDIGFDERMLRLYLPLVRR